MKNKKVIKRAFEQMIILTLLAVLLALLIASALNDMYAFIKQSGHIELSLSSPLTLKKLSRMLRDRGVIKNPLFFSLFVKSKSMQSRLESFVGDVTLDKNMSYREIILAFKK